MTHIPGKAWGRRFPDAGWTGTPKLRPGSRALTACLVAGSPLTIVLLVTAYSKTFEQVSKFMLVLINQPTTALGAVVTFLAEKDGA